MVLNMEQSVILIDNEVYEITTYRIEGEYENNRRA